MVTSKTVRSLIIKGKNIGRRTTIQHKAWKWAIQNCVGGPVSGENLRDVGTFHQKTYGMSELFTRKLTGCRNFSVENLQNVGTFLRKTYGISELFCEKLSSPENLREVRTFLQKTYGRSELFCGKLAELSAKGARTLS
ncbi:hypothetical protein RRG08_030922 [Elysia crispata]|uniref:Uncharacterized protein n=1 Tax=Elysia crispata TaxID=231223 RepID=A0AAE1ABE2_9GAST|nr:hypothetical protein RRG08_030922 [Elysia crispata]